MRAMVLPDRQMAVVAIDLLAVLASYGSAFLLRFDLELDSGRLASLILTAPYAALSYLLASYYFGVNRGLRYYASFGDLFDIVKTVSCAAALHAVLILPVAEARVPVAILFSWPVLALCAVAGLRVCARCASHYVHVHLSGRTQKRVAVIVGVGDLAELVYQNMRSDEAVDYRVAGFYDEDPSKFGVRLHGVPVVGVPALIALLKRVPVDEIVVAVDRRRRGGVLDSVADALQGLEKRPAVLVAPTLEEALKAPRRAEPRKVRPADLLNRRVISLDTARIGRSIDGKVVLITGAGGTIGGELARQVAQYKPKKLILLENSATALFYAEADLRETRPELEVAASLGDVRDLGLVDRIFREDRPQIVFHAAAHKHVHQLEDNVYEGVSNNLLGTYHLANAADRNGVEAFILISTDKAVRPSCVMGATKRGAEMAVSSLARQSKTRFASVRFGNVLGSSGSVLKIFQEQLENGRPLTVTHPEATRYFMTVEEAVGLVLQASTLAKGGEVFVLKMGAQIRIVDMARRLIWLSGLEPDRDVDIRVVGLRPGEKIAEELVEDASGQEQSEHPEIMVLRSENKELDELTERISRLELLGLIADRDAMLQALAQLVPTYAANLGAEGLRVHPADEPVRDASAK